MINKKQSCENAFMLWLSARFSSVQLSNLRWCYVKIESACRNAHILSSPLFETTDLETIRSVKRYVEHNKLFRIGYFRKYNEMVSAANLYFTYISTRNAARDEKIKSANPMIAQSGEEKEPSEIATPLEKEKCAPEESILIEENVKTDEAEISDENNKSGEIKTDDQTESQHEELECEVEQKPSDDITNDDNHIDEADVDISNAQIVSRSLFYYYLLDNRQIAMSMCKKYADALEICESFAAAHHYKYAKIYDVSAAEAQKTIELLKSDSEFVKYSRWKGLLPSQALSLFLDYVEEETTHTPQVNFNKEQIRYAKKETLPVKTEVDELLSDECFSELRKALGRKGIKTISELREFRLWPYMNRNDLYRYSERQEIYQKVRALLRTLDSEAPKTAEETQKSDEKLIPEYIAPARQVEQCKIEAAGGGADKSLKNLIEREVRDADMNGITCEELRDKHRTFLTTIKEAVQSCNSIIEINGRLYHEEAFVDWDDGAKQMCFIIEKLMQKNNGYVSSAQLYSYAKSEMNMFLNDNDLNDERSVYEMAQHLFEKKGFEGHHYSFVNKTHISNSENAINSNFDIISKFAKDQGGVFSEDDLKEYLAGLGFKAENARSQMQLGKKPGFFLYESGTIISAECMGIDDSWKESVKRSLNNLLNDAEGHIILRQIQPVWYESLPALPENKCWTPLLLQYVLRFYGEILGAKTIMAMESQGMETLHAMLVKYDGPIQNFGDAVIAYLIDIETDRRTFEAEELRQFLVKAGMLKGNELIWNIPKALAKDDRFAWDAKGENVTVRV